RIVGAFLAAMVAMVAAMGFLVVEYGEVSASQAMITESYLPIGQNVDALRLYQQRVDNDIERLRRDGRRPGTGAASSAVIYTDALQDQLEQARSLALQAQSQSDNPQEQAFLHKVKSQLSVIESLFVQYQNQSAQVVSLFEQDSREEALARVEPLKQDAHNLGEEIDSLSRAVQGHIKLLALTTEQMRTRANAVAVTLTLVALGVFGAGIAAVLFALRPIGDLTGQVQRLAAGDYTGRVDIPSGDEFAVLAGEFNAMVTALRLRDKTLVERAEQLNVLTRYLGSVLDTLDDSLFVVEDQQVTLANPAARRLWDAHEEGAPPATLVDFLGKSGRHEIERNDGSLHEVRATKFGDEGFVVVIADVTEQKRSAERLARSERLALVGQMLAQITHEVRNPLNSLGLNADMLGDELGALDPDRKTEAWDLLGVVSGEIDRLTEVTAHYLAMARRPKAQLAPVDYPGLLDDVVRLISLELDQQSISLALHHSPMGPQLADGNQIRQSLLNVVRNAAEAGATALVLTLDHDAHNVRITLEDNGPGMTQDEIDRATDPFFSTKAQGTGLGLAITRQILEDHDGQLEVISCLGTGSTVTLVLPQRVAPTQHEALDG
ncbi:MAG: HAMP domain-containing protein, partial [Rhodobacterales bacterium]|nr:HAMP domain-containing protein [Rhodobacterales bacterium]